MREWIRWHLVYPPLCVLAYAFGRVLGFAECFSMVLRSACGLITDEELEAWFNEAE